MRYKFCLGPNLSIASGSLLLTPSRWQCVYGSGLGSLDENFAGYRKGRNHCSSYRRASSHTGIICPPIESPTMCVPCGRYAYPGALWSTRLTPSLFPGGPVHPALPCTQVHEGLDGGQTWPRVLLAPTYQESPLATWSALLMQQWSHSQVKVAL